METALSLLLPPAYVNACVSIRQHASAYVSIRNLLQPVKVAYTCVYIESIRQHPSASVSIRRNFLQPVKVAYVCMYVYMYIYMYINIYIYILRASHK